MPPHRTADAPTSSLNRRTFPLDLQGIYIWILLALVGIYVPIINESFLRVLFALPLILFIPGYLLIAALFPARDDLDWIERIALSFGLSIAIVPLIGLALNYTPFGIRLDPIVISLVAFSIAAGVAAQYRRSRVPEEKRFSIPVDSITAAIKTEFFSETAPRTDRLLSMILLVAIVVAIGATAYVVVVPKKGEKFTEFYILGPKGKAADYPTDFAAGTPQLVFIGIGNHEYEDITYTVETFAVHQVLDEKTNQSTIVSATLLDRFAVSVPNNATVEQPYSFRISDPNVNRVEFLLFKEPPQEGLNGSELIGASYRDLHLWVNVRS
jgi:uncharacterized membrane protein